MVYVMCHVSGLHREDVEHQVSDEVACACKRCGRRPGLFVSGFPPFDRACCFRWFVEYFSDKVPFGTVRAPEEFAAFALKRCEDAELLRKYE